MNLLGWLKAPVNSALFVLALVLGAWLMLDTIDLAHKDRDIATLNGRLTNLQAAMALCRGNVAALSSSVDKQNAAIAIMSKADSDRLKASQDSLDLLLKAQASRDAALRQLLAPLPPGDVCARVQEVDKRLVGSLK